MPQATQDTTATRFLPAIALADLFQKKTLFYTSLIWWGFFGRFDWPLIKACLTFDLSRAWGDIAGSAIVFAVICAVVAVVRKAKA